MGRRITLGGTVQGIGMRPLIYRVAREHGIGGRVWNEPAGVVIEAFGTEDALHAFVGSIRADAPAAARIEALSWRAIPARDAADFVIAHSDGGPGHRVSIPPDLATCPECAAEIADPENRRYRYPFTNCTNCGPRFTIATGAPYDRATTTMASFAMCAACQHEYDDPLNRRFHAQPNACPVCGPLLVALLPDGRGAGPGDPVRLAARALAAGLIVAVKGIGGFHLACDATQAEAVRRLRQRKQRDEKPFAVMVPDLAAARQIAIVSAAAEQLLCSIERPIVLMPRHAGAALAADVAPRNPLVGVMLPYTPLHHLLLADAGVPLVMTSANRSEDPIVYRNDEAVARLGAIADVLLVHDREIVTRCDDSVTAIIAGAPTLLRRSRGYVPRAIRLPQPARIPVLACGALLKNTFCIAHREQAWLGPHIGDLENADTFTAYCDAIERMEQFVGTRAEILAHDLHPDYLSTRYAQGRDGVTVPVQHHHAHVASAIAEHGLCGPVIGVAFDGTGYGTDGTAWGGEFLVADARSARRVATFRPLPLAGADAAIRNPWRIALALLADAFDHRLPLDSLQLFDRISAAEVRGVRQMLASRLNTPLARGVGRYFDGIGAMVLARPYARYEGQIAFELNMAAAAGEYGTYQYQIERGADLLEIDCRNVVQEIVRDMIEDVPAAVVAARFHNTMIAATAETVRQISATYGLAALPVVLTGGCFQNARLTEGVLASLASCRAVFVHRQVPPGDGGIALGQALVAAAVTAR